MNNLLKTLFPLYFVVFLGFVGYSLMITIFTPMFMHLDTPILPATSTLSLRTVVLGIILFLYPFGQFISSPIMGALSDKYGRKRLIILTTFLAIVSYLLIAFSIKISNVYWLGLFLFIAGLFEGNVTLAQSTIADLTPPESRARYFGYIYLSASLAYVVGPLLGGKLADPSLVSWFHYSTPFWAVAILLLLAFLWILFSFKETHILNKKEEIHLMEAFTNMKNIFLSKDIRFLYGVNFLLYLAIFGFFRSYPMYIVDEFNVGVSKLSELIAWVAVPIILVNMWLLGYLSKKLSPRTITLIFAFLTALFIQMIVIFRSFSSLWVTLFLAAFAIAFTLPSSVAFLSSSVSAEKQGRVMGNNQSLQYFAESFSGLFAGFLAAILVKLPLILTGICSLVGALLLLFRKDKPS